MAGGGLAFRPIPATWPLPASRLPLPGARRPGRIRGHHFRLHRQHALVHAALAALPVRCFFIRLDGEPGCFQERPMVVHLRRPLTQGAMAVPAGEDETGTRA